MWFEGLLKVIHLLLSIYHATVNVMASSLVSFYHRIDVV